MDIPRCGFIGKTPICDDNCKLKLCVGALVLLIFYDLATNRMYHNTIRILQIVVVVIAFLIYVPTLKYVWWHARNGTL